MRNQHPAILLYFFHRDTASKETHTQTSLSCNIPFVICSLFRLRADVPPKPTGTFRAMMPSGTRTNLKEGMGGLLNRIGISSSGDERDEGKDTKDGKDKLKASASSQVCW